MGSTFKKIARVGAAAATGGATEVLGVGEKLTAKKPKVAAVSFEDEKRQLAAAKPGTFTQGGLLGVEYNPTANKNTTFGN